MKWLSYSEHWLIGKWSPFGKKWSKSDALGFENTSNSLFGHIWWVNSWGSPNTPPLCWVVAICGNQLLRTSGVR